MTAEEIFANSSSGEDKWRDVHSDTGREAGARDAGTCDGGGASCVLRRGTAWLRGQQTACACSLGAERACCEGAFVSSYFDNPHPQRRQTPEPCGSSPTARGLRKSAGVCCKGPAPNGPHEDREARPPF